MINWDDREQSLLDRLDAVLAIIEDNPLYEQYASRNIVNYLQGIKLIKEIKSREVN